MPCSAISAPSQDLDGDRGVLVRDLAGAVGEEGGRGDVGGQVLKLAGTVLRLGGDPGDLRLGGDLVGTDQRRSSSTWRRGSSSASEARKRSKR